MARWSAILNRRIASRSPGARFPRNGARCSSTAAGVWSTTCAASTSTKMYCPCPTSPSAAWARRFTTKKASACSRNTISTSRRSGTCVSCNQSCRTSVASVRSRRSSSTRSSRAGFSIAPRRRRCVKSSTVSPRPGSRSPSSTRAVAISTCCRATPRKVALCRGSADA